MLKRAYLLPLAVLLFSCSQESQDSSYMSKQNMITVKKP